jgi:hypothetical protein
VWQQSAAKGENTVGEYSIIQHLIMAAVHVAAFVIAMSVIEKLFNNRLAAILGGAAYVFIPYRFYTMYVSKDYMEMIAWTCMPVIGYLICVVYERCHGRIKKILLACGSFVLIAGIVNLTWYIENIRKLSAGEIVMADGFSLQAHGLYLIHYLMFFFTLGSSDEFMENGMIDSAPMGIGALLIIGVCLYVWLLALGKLRGQSGICNYLLILGLIAAYLSSNSCPWDMLLFSSKLYKMVYLLIKEPFRLLVIAALCFWTVSCKAYAVLYDIIKQAQCPKSEDGT